MEPRDEPLVAASGLTKRFGRTTAVDRLSLTVGPGELIGLIGVNGAGKTTLLRLLSGILRPDEGEIAVCGFGVGPDEVRGRARLAFASDNPAVFEAFTVEEHCRLVGRLHRLEDWEARAAALLDRFGIADRREQVAGALSLGLKQRLALCLAFLHGPQVLLLDEPLNGLDPPTRSVLWELLRERLAEGACAILSSHQLELVERLAGRVLVMSAGGLRWDGSPESLRESGAEGLEELLSLPPPLPRAER